MLIYNKRKLKESYTLYGAPSSEHPFFSPMIRYYPGFDDY